VTNVAQEPGEVARAAFEVQHLEARDAVGGLVRLLHPRLGQRHRGAGGRGDLAGDPQHGQEVGSVRRDLDVQHGVVQIEGGLEVLPRLEALGQDEDAVVGRRDGELHRRAQHPVGHDAPDLARPERIGQCRNGGAGGRERNEVARSHVPNADDDLLFPRTRLHAGDAERHALRMVADLDDACDHHARQSFPRSLDRLDLGALAREELGELLGSELGRAELAEPGKDDPHAAPSNCSRNRTSPSANWRRSFTP
jgi:hypothetical protein